MNTKHMNQYQLSSADPQKRKSPIIIQNLTETRTNQLMMIRKTLSQITQITSENIDSLKETKSAIIQTLQTKIDTKNRKSFYDLLDEHNKNFLLNFNNDDSLTDGNYMAQNLTSAMKEKEIEKQKMFEFKEWIKNPEHFESYFNTKLTKETLKQILEPKYELLKMLSKMESFLEQCGLKYYQKGCNNNFNLALIDSNNMEEFLNIIESLIITKRNKTVEEKQRILNIMLLNIQNESEPRTINFYMENFINLYQSLNSFSPYTRFTTTETSMQEFNFSIDHTTVVLRNPQLNEQKSYEKMTYESEFAFINDGEYVFNNEYRASYLCWEDVNEMERSVNTMIGSEYVMMVNEEDEFECCEQEIEGKLIEINNYLRSDKKISLRLRLNSVEFDKITIKILQSRTWEQFIEDKKESCHEFNFQIIPDEGDNLHIYGFTSSKAQSHSESINYPHEQEESKLNDLSIIEEQEHSQQTHLVLEDDIISLFLTSDENYIVCWNETRNHLIHKIHVQKPVINLVENLPFESQLYVGIVLYTTVPEIEIYDHK